MSRHSLRNAVRNAGLVVPCALAMLAISAQAARAAEVAWGIHATAQPSTFSPTDQSRCEEQNCARYQVLVANMGSEASVGPMTLTVRLPPGITTHRTQVEGGETSGGGTWTCTGGAGISLLTCTFPESLPSGGYSPYLTITVNPPSPALTGPLTVEFDAEGGGAPGPVTKSIETPVIPSGLPPFDITQFAFEPRTASGAFSLQAGGHPWQLSTTFSTSTKLSPPSPRIFNNFVPIQNIKNVVVDLPLGMVGNPLATSHCTQRQLVERACPPGSRVGEFAITAGQIELGQYVYSGQSCCSAVYNMVPERGYPAEFSFTYAEQTVTLYASVVHTGGGYRLRVATTGVPAVLEVTGAVLTFFGDPSAADGGPSGTAFLTNPSSCGAANPAHMTVTPWETPQERLVADAPAYPQTAGCEDLRFEPTFAFQPSASSEGGSSRADTPSAYTADLEVPQQAGYSELATPPLRDASVTLPAGVSVSAPAAQGLVGCEPTGPAGINIGSPEVGADGQDLGDPEATELGAGHAGGNGSPYDDGLYHTAPGHCPPASTLGEVEVFTPLLPTGPHGEAPLTGHVYLAAPRCGGATQPPCTEASATNGELFGLYVEAAGSGVIVKLAGTVSADPATGRLRATFSDNPQFPFSDLRFHFHGGPRAPLANPQSCGGFAADSQLTSWGEQVVSGTSPGFTVDWDGAGAPCPPMIPFAPRAAAGSSDPQAGAFTPFVLHLSREDREQDVAGLTETLPPGLLARVAGVPLCGSADAGAGTCGAASQIGTVSAQAGAGSAPITIGGGRIYLTGPYRGAPYGLSIVQPAKAGPFNLGDVIVRATIHIDPSTAAITVSSDPIPLIRDGVPFRLRALNIEISRPGGFTFNPTDCSQHAIVTTVSGSQGANTPVSTPFTVTGCSALPFHPRLTARTSGKASRRNGASLHVKLTYPKAPFGSQANIRSVHVELPKALPSRLSTLNHACLDSVFNQDPASCPSQSRVGFAKAVTPVLPVPLEGPAYFVSHGGQKFPELIVVLQGYGVTVHLQGETFISKAGITSSTFRSVPDVPVGSFELTLPEGPFSALAANRSLCETNLAMPTTFDAQNGATLKQNTQIEVEDCPYSLRVVHRSVHKRTLALNVLVPQAGELTASGNGVTSAAKSAKGRSTLTLTLKGRHAGRLHTTVLLRFTPKTGKQRKVLRKTLHVTFG